MIPGSRFTAKLADTEGEIIAAQALRYDVFVCEFGGDGPMVDHAAGLECDRFDPYVDHMLLYDDSNGRLAGVYRLLRQEQATKVGQFYSEDEYDLSCLKRSGRHLLELGRSCLRREYRGGSALPHLWNALADYVSRHRIDILFGVASFHGTNVKAISGALSMLHHEHLAPEKIRPRARDSAFQRMDLVAPDRIDRKQAMLATPALVKAYLRLGGFIGEGAFVDRMFNTIDICLVLDTGRVNERQRRFYGRKMNV